MAAYATQLAPVALASRWTGSRLRGSSRAWHDDAEASGGVAADAGAEFIAEAERAADFEGVGQVACVERDHGWVAVDFDGHLHGGGVAVGIAVDQGELTAFVPIQASWPEIRISG